MLPHKSCKCDASSATKEPHNMSRAHGSITHVMFSRLKQVPYDIAPACMLNDRQDLVERIRRAWPVVSPHIVLNATKVQRCPREYPHTDERASKACGLEKTDITDGQVKQDIAPSGKWRASQSTPGNPCCIPPVGVRSTRHTHKPRSQSKPCHPDHRATTSRGNSEAYACPQERDSPP